MKELLFLLCSVAMLVMGFGIAEEGFIKSCETNNLYISSGNKLYKCEAPTEGK